MFAGKKSAQIREILISESAWEEMTCLFAPSLSEEILVIFLSTVRRTTIMRVDEKKNHLIKVVLYSYGKLFRSGNLREFFLNPTEL